MYICIYVYMNIYMYIYFFVCECVQVCMHACMYTCMHVCLSVCLLVVVVIVVVVVVVAVIVEVVVIAAAAGVVVVGEGARWIDGRVRFFTVVVVIVGVAVKEVLVLVVLVLVLVVSCGNPDRRGLGRPVVRMLFFGGTSTRVYTRAQARGATSRAPACRRRHRGRSLCVRRSVFVGRVPSSCARACLDQSVIH